MIEGITYKAIVRKDGAFAISKTAREALGLKQGDEIEVSIIASHEIRLPSIHKKHEIEEITERGIRLERLRSYLKSAIFRGDISVATEDNTHKSLFSIESVFPRIPPPDISIGPDAQTLLIWDRAEHHLILEVFPDSTVELFYHNRLTDDAWEYDSVAGDELPQDISERVQVLFQDAK